jgi:hypothetical protein
MSKRDEIEAETRYAQELPGFKKTDPQYFADGMIDRLVEVVLALGGELWSVRHRLAIIEKLSAEGQRISSDMIETFKADPEFKAGLEEERLRMIKQIFASFAGDKFPDVHSPAFAWVTKVDIAKESAIVDTDALAAIKES